MKISDLITQRILQLMEEQDGTAEIQRNEFAGEIGCVPSQINYVLTSRFTPEQGYTIESRRGGGGYIRITRITVGPQNFIMHVVNSIGETLDENTARILLKNLAQRGHRPTDALGGVRQDPAPLSPRLPRQGASGPV